MSNHGFTLFLTKYAFPGHPRQLPWIVTTNLLRSAGGIGKGMNVAVVDSAAATVEETVEAVLETEAEAVSEEEAVATMIEEVVSTTMANCLGGPVVPWMTTLALAMRIAS